MAKNKHLTKEDRFKIEQLLGGRVPLKKIAAELGKDRTTISREIRSRIVESNKGAACRITNRCVKRRTCTIVQLCEDKPDCTRKCSTCKSCNTVCNEFVEEVCQKLSRPPYVCNGCPEEHRCVLKKKYYFHKKAHEKYRNVLVESRAGANITESGLAYLDELVSPLILRGQSVHHIAKHNADKLEVSEKSVYRYVAGGLLSARNIDMPRVCRLKPRKSKPVAYKVDKKCRIGRTHDDYLEFIQSTGLPTVQIDTVIGRVGGKVLLTLLLDTCDFMLAFIRDRNTSQSVIDIFDCLDKILGREMFSRIFGVCLGDNGTEFSNPKALEYDAASVQRMRLFYCDPNAAYQKPNIEVSHELIRRVLPKGASFDSLNQGDIDLMMSHINSYSREKLGDKSPYDLFCFLHNDDLAGSLNIKRIPPNEILLKPRLLKE